MCVFHIFKIFLYICNPKGESYKSLSFQYRMGACTVSRIVSETSDALHKVLKDDYLKVRKRWSILILMKMWMTSLKIPTVCNSTLQFKTNNKDEKIDYDQDLENDSDYLSFKDFYFYF